MKWYVGAFQKFAEFNGRARRTEYWMFMLFNILISIALSIVEVAADMKLPILSGLYSLAVLIPALAVAVRRLHDTGRSGWWLLLAFVPILGGLVLLVFAVLDSQPDANEYGPNPKLAQAVPA